MAREVSNLFMCLMGMGTVFVGLICIVLICRVLGMAVQGAQRRRLTVLEPVGALELDIVFAPVVSAPSVVMKSAPAVSEEPEMENRQQLIAAISVAIAEEMGTDVSGIRVMSFKQI